MPPKYNPQEKDKQHDTRSSTQQPGGQSSQQPNDQLQERGGESSGDTSIDWPGIMPGFSAEQTRSLTTRIQAICSKTIDESFIKWLPHLRPNPQNRQDTPTFSVKEPTTPITPATAPPINHQQINYIPRFRSDNLGTYNPNKDNVYAFISRIQEVASLKGVRTVQMNISISLRKKAKR